METKTKLTAEELFKLYPEESRLELIDGEVFEMPASSLMHQEILMRIAFSLRVFLKEGGGSLFVSPVDVVFSENVVLQPDIVFVKEVSIQDLRINKYPELIVEVVSPSTFKRDLTDKMKIYENFGVKEYWLIFPLEKTILIYALTQKGYELFSSATEKGKVKSKVLEGFELDAEEVFGGL